MSSKAKEGNRIYKRSLEKAIKIENTKAYPMYHFELNLTDTKQGLSVCVYQIDQYVNDATFSRIIIT